MSRVLPEGDADRVASQPVVLDVADVSHRYPPSRRHGAAAVTPRVLDQLTFQLQQGELFVLTGPNGSGKSTLFRILCGLLQPGTGRVRVGGVDLFACPEQARRHYGVVFQKPALDPLLSARENLQVHARLYGVDRQQMHRRMEESLAWTVVRDRLDDPVRTLSGGMARQVELAKAMLHQPSILLMDEPTTGLDPNSRRQLQRSRPLSVLMTSHLFEEAEEADRMGILHHGVLLVADAPEVLRARIGQEVIIVRSDPGALDSIAHALEGLGMAATVWRCGESELRIQDADALELLHKLLQDHRARIRSIELKKPTLEDVFVHLTGLTGRVAPPVPELSRAAAA
jgi:ABC-2 type transport system ATP-binding protein